MRPFRLEQVRKTPKFGRLTPIEYNAGFWTCLCECGKTIHITTGALTKGQESCGCLARENTSKKFKKHGHSGHRASKEYRAWKSIKNRCYNKNGKNFAGYGGRGITVCRRWLQSFKNFLVDMGPAPGSDYTIERIKNDKGYSPDNCIWETRKTQSRNKRNNLRLTVDGVTKTAIEWAEISGTSCKNISQRHHKLKWSDKEAVWGK